MSDQAARVEQLLLGGERKYTRAQVCDKAGVPQERATALWRSLGFATVGDDAIVFTDADADALRATHDLMYQGLLAPDMATATARMLGQHLSRLAEWQVDVLRELLSANPEMLADERHLAALLERLVPELERLQDYAWRRHLSAHAGRALARPGEIQENRTAVVGFADMVGFTALTRRTDEAGLVSVVDRFDAITADVVADNRGRIVKMLGDEVLFVADTPRDGAEIALGLLAAADADPDLPALRAGVAYGRVLSRFGDVYGSVVNIAARLTSVARPGSVLIDRALADELKPFEAYAIRGRRPVSVRGYSRLRLAVLRRAGDRDSVSQRAARLLTREEDDSLPVIPLEPDQAPRKRRRRREPRLSKP